MLHVLPVEISLAVLSYLPLSALCPLYSLSRKWLNFFSDNEFTIFHNAAIFHGYIPPDTSLLEDALSMHKGSPWEGAMDWKDFCRRSLQVHKNWEGNGRVVARLLKPPGNDVHRIKVDEKAGILIATHKSGGLSVTHLFSSVLLWSLPRYYVRSSAHCEYENGYLVFDCFDGKKEVWRLASDFADGEVGATHAPPDEQQKRAYAFFGTTTTATTTTHHHGSRGHFRPWAKLSFPTVTYAYRLAYPTLLCAGTDRAFLHDVRTGLLVQTIDFSPRLDNICYVDVNERHAFVCEPEALHVFLRGEGEGAGAAPGGAAREVLRIPQVNSFPKNHRISIPTPVEGDEDPFVSVLPLRPWYVEYPPQIIAAHVSRDGRDLVIMTIRSQVFIIRDFERICRGETSIVASGSVLHLSGLAKCFYLAFEHGRVCVATFLGLYIFAVNETQGDLTDLTKVVFVQPFAGPVPAHPQDMSCMQLTDRRVYFTWDDASRRDVPLFKDEENEPDISRVDPEFESTSVGCIDFSLLPES